MKTNQTVFTREEFYDLIWTSPLSHIAKSFAVPVHVLVKLCAQFNIPRPDPEYWPYLRLGYTLEKTPLGPALAGADDKIEVRYTPRTQRGVPSADPLTVPGSPIPAEPAQQPHLELAADFRKAHPLVRKAKELLERNSCTENGLQRPGYGESCLHIKVSRGCLRRALLIMDAIIRELERRGYAAQVAENRWDTVVLIDEDKVHISLNEKVERRERELTAEEKKTSYVSDRYTWHPTAQLSFQVQEYQPEGTRKSWADGKHQRLDDFLIEVVEAIIATGAALKQRRLVREERERQWAEEEKIRAEIQRRRERESARQKALEEQSARWHSAERIREFVQVCRHSLAGRGVMHLDSPAHRWIDWALLHADRIDPLRNGWLDEAVANLPPGSMRPVGSSPPSVPPPPTPA